MATTDELTERLRAFAYARDWERFHDPKNLAMLVCSEAGEVAALLRWVANSEADEFVARPENRSALADEIADVGIGLLMLCSRVGLRLEDVVEQKIAKNEGRFPVPAR